MVESPAAEQIKATLGNKDTRLVNKKPFEKIAIINNNSKERIAQKLKSTPNIPTLVPKRSSQGLRGLESIKIRFSFWNWRIRTERDKNMLKKIRRILIELKPISAAFCSCLKF